jgi:hydrogenase expression/formation protein HypE
MEENEFKPEVSMEGAVCPVPLRNHEQVMLGHGSGGRMTQELIQRYFYPPLENEILLKGEDAASVAIPVGGRMAVSTDSHIVSPLFFPGGDIGKLAICGTVNDLAMMGAQPLWLTAAFILEEGFSLECLERVLESMQEAAEEAGVEVIAGDTKVAERGKADGLFINTTGVGVIPEGRRVSAGNAQPGDVVLLSGPIADHGIAVLAARGELAFDAEVVSDIAPLNAMVEAMFASGSTVHVMRDPTRGGVASALNEIAIQSSVSILVDESSLPIHAPTLAACEMLGFDPLYVANEGKLLAIVPDQDAQTLLDAMHSSPYGEQACKIGEVQKDPQGRVLMRTSVGGTRVIDTLSGEMLPRIC